MISRYLTLEDATVWPSPEAAGELAWRLRYAPTGLTEEDRLVTASVLEAYLALCVTPSMARKLPMLRRAAANHKDPRC